MLLLGEMESLKAEEQLAASEAAAYPHLENDARQSWVRGVIARIKDGLPLVAPRKKQTPTTDMDAAREYFARVGAKVKQKGGEGGGK